MLPLRLCWYSFRIKFFRQLSSPLPPQSSSFNGPTILLRNLHICPLPSSPPIPPQIFTWIPICYTSWPLPSLSSSTVTSVPSVTSVYYFFWISATRFVSFVAASVTSLS